MAIAGHMGDAVYIAAVAVGSMIFNVIYWLCGFLRMGTSGMTSQALGRRDLKGVAMIMARGMSVALAIASAILVLQLPIGRLAIWMVGAGGQRQPHGMALFLYMRGGAPAMLSLYALTGWYVGMQNTRLPMMISIMQNVVNIIASFTFVYVFGMKVEGVAMGTVVAQYAGIIVSAWLWTRTYGARLFHRICWREIMEADALKRFFCRQSRHIPPHAVSRSRKLLLSLRRSLLRSRCARCQHASYAALHAVLLRDGRLRLCWRSVVRKALRSGQ